MGNIFISSDFHLAHNSILLYQQERFKFFGNDVDMMNDVLIDTCNKYVQKKDTLWVLGDWCWKASKYGHFRQRINCREIHVVAGNHDTSSLRNHVSSYREIVYTKIAGYSFHLCHYPLYSWRNREHGTIHLYGHCHGSIEDRMNELFPDRKSQDVGVDYAYRLFGEFRPFSLDEILKRNNK